MAVIKSKYSSFDIPDMSYSEFLFGYMQEHFDDPCETESETGRTQTYREVIHQCFRVAAYLQKKGLQPKDKVAFYCGNVLEYLPSVLGVMVTGGAVTFIRPELVDNQEYRNKMGMPRFVFSSPVNAPALLDAGYKNIIVIGEAKGCTSFDEVIATDVSSFQKPEIPPNSLATVSLTGGTTGLPKGIEWSHRNLVAVAAVSLRCKLTLGLANEVGETPVFLSCFPTNHSSGFIFRTSCLLFGTHSILLNSPDPVTVCKSIEKHKVTCTLLAPGPLFGVLKLPEECRRDLSSLRDVTVIGGYLTPSVQQDVKKTLHLRGILHRHVMSEIVATVFEASEVPRSVGKVLPNMEVKVVNIATGQLQGPHEMGEMYIRGPTVFTGYHNNPKATEEILSADGWLKTEDIVYYDEDENFYFVDRIKEIIKHKEGFIGGPELEVILASHPSVREAAVIGVPSEDSGEVPRAYVMLNEKGSPVTEKELLGFVRGKVEPYKNLSGGLAIVDNVPRTVIGKPLKREILKNYLENNV